MEFIHGREDMNYDWIEFMYNVHDHLQHMEYEEILEVQRKETLPFAVAAFNLAGDLNISNMVRSAAVFGAQKFYLIGKKRFDRRGCVGAQNYIDIEHYEDQIKALKFLTEEYDPYFVEQGGEDIATVDFYGHQKPICLIFGSEADGISEVVMAYGAGFRIPVISIDQVGVLRSLNVASAAAIAMWKVAMDLRPVPRSTL
jgi:tRNA G18 (ribose-2'-O)-methylase SpoU